MTRISAKRQAGLTLIELITVLILIDTLSGLLVTRGSPTAATLNAQADQLARALRHAQSLSLAQGRSLSFSVPTTTSYSISDGVSTVTNPQGVLQDYALINGVTLAGSDLDFDSLGRPIDTSDNLINTARTWTLSIGGSTASVSVEPLTGFVSVTP